MKIHTEAEKDLLAREGDPVFEAAYATARRRIRQFDAVILVLDSRRIELGMSKAELSKKSGIPASAVRRLFSNQQKNPTLNTLISISDALNLRIWLCEGSDTRFDHLTSKAGFTNQES